MSQKEWSRSQVAAAHNYTKHYDLTCEHHKIFSKWLEQKFINKQTSIFDIGSGNSNAMNYIDERHKYTGVDINQAAIDFAQKHKKNNCLFLLQDIEEELSQQTVQEIENCDVCYIDSVFTMLENPAKVLQEILIPNFDIIFLGRTKFMNENTVKTKHRWAGMEKESTLWVFNKKFFEDITQDTEHTCKFIGDVNDHNKNLSRIIISKTYNDMSAWIT